MITKEDLLKELLNDFQDIGRCVYYAKAYEPDKNINVHLDRILQILGYCSPEQVGLSKRIIK